MPELATIEALQPSLLDRLTDRSRFLERVQIAYRTAVVEEAGLTVDAVRNMLQSLGLTCVDEAADETAETWDCRPDVRSFRSILDLRPRPDAPPLEALLELRSRQLVPNSGESRDERVISSRRLRQMVLRDLGWLLNTGSLAEVTPIDGYPNVEASVLNYGVPDLTGVSLSGADMSEFAERIRIAIERFEPRIRNVSVTPVERDVSGRVNTMAFRIEGELWGQPLPEQLFLHTELDLEDATMTISEANDG